MTSLEWDQRFWISIKHWADAAGQRFEWEEYGEPFFCYKIENWWQEQRWSARLYEYNLKGGSLKWGQGKAGISPLLEQNEWELTFIKHQFCTWHVHTHSLSQILGRTGFSFYCHERLGTVLKLTKHHELRVCRNVSDKAENVNWGTEDGRWESDQKEWWYYSLQSSAARRNPQQHWWALNIFTHMCVHVCTHTHSPSLKELTTTTQLEMTVVHIKPRSIWLKRLKRSIWLFPLKKLTLKSLIQDSQSWGRSFKEKPCKAVASLS